MVAANLCALWCALASALESLHLRRGVPMSKCLQSVVCLLVFMSTSASLFAQQQQKQALQLAGIFGNNMVLQQKSEAAIWGVAKPGQSVSVAPSWTKKVAKVTSGADGKWKTTIQTPEAGGPHTIAIKSSGQQKMLKNVLTGEVWVCSCLLYTSPSPRDRG